MDGIKRIEVLERRYNNYFDEKKALEKKTKNSPCRRETRLPRLKRLNEDLIQKTVQELQELQYLVDLSQLR